MNALQVYGPAGTAGAISSGSVQFDDGTSVRLGAIAGDSGSPTTVAFPARSITSLTVHLVPKTSAPLQLRELAAFGPGTIAPSMANPRGSIVHPAAAESCAGAASSTTAALTLVCPATGTVLPADATVVLSGPEGTLVGATAVLARGGTTTIGNAIVTGGVARLRVDSTVLPGGPVAIRFTGVGLARPLTAQFINGATALATPGPSATAGARSLVFDDEFDSPLSVSRSGTKAAYTAMKPEWYGGSEFGDAIFANPRTNPENLSTTSNGVLRLRVTPLAAGETDPNGWGRTRRGAIVSSASIAGGFSAQHAYFEARMLAPAGRGTWPAFWLDSDGSLDGDHAVNSEVDAVELYGQETAKSCHSWHNWPSGTAPQNSSVTCLSTAPDWSDGWHTYGVDISQSATKYYVDGRLVHTGIAVAHADDPFFFMLDLALGGGWPTDLSAVHDTADLYVDYVRVYT